VLSRIFPGGGEFSPPSFVVEGEELFRLVALAAAAAVSAAAEDERPAAAGVVS